MRKVDGRRTPSDGKSSHCLWQGELNMRYIGYGWKILPCNGPTTNTVNKLVVLCVQEWWHSTNLRRSFASRSHVKVYKCLTKAYL